MTSVTELNDIIIEKGRLIVNRFESSDKEIVDFFQQIEPSTRNECFHNLLRVGVVAIKTAGITDRIREDGKIMMELFDPNKEGTPLYYLRNDIRNEIVGLRQQISAKEAKDELINKTTLKGKSFEDRCEAIIGDGARVFGDLLENTTTKEGKLKDSKKGDFVVNQKEINKRIVFEVKDVSTISAYQIQKTLQESIENRDASYGILVVKSVESLPKSIGWFQEIGHNMLVCALSTLEKDDDALHAELLLIGYKWARLRIMLQNFRENKIDAEFIQDKISRIQHKISELRTIKIQCRNIETASDKIRTVSKQLEDDIGRELSEILGSINSKCK